MNRKRNSQGKAWDYMERKDFSNLGEDIKEIVTEAVNNMDFEKLNQDIKKTAKDALEQAKAGLEAGRERMRSSGFASFSQQEMQKRNENVSGGNAETGSYGDLSGKEQASTDGGKSGTWKNETGTFAKGSRGRYTAPSYQKEKKAPALKKKMYLTRCPSGTVSGTLMVVFGVLFSSGFGITALVMFCIMVATGFSGVFQGLFLGFFLAAVVSGFLAHQGNQKTLQVKRFRQYVRILGDRTFCQIEELAGQIGRDRRFVLRDIRKMISDGIFPQGHLDDQETCLMITDENYQQYRAAQEEYKKREEKEKKAVEAVAKAKKMEEDERSEKQEKKKNAEKDSIYENEKLDRELLNAYKEGKGYLDEISKVNKEISEPEIAAKISHMEVVIRRIFKQVQSHPEQLEEIRRFMEYYLPTTLKLVTAYSEFDAQPVQGENITKAKHEIEETLDTINEAFEKLLDSLFESAALDISTDISVMNTMLAQEGLTGDASFSDMENPLG